MNKIQFIKGDYGKTLGEAFITTFIDLQATN
jgi:hypothetical protein